MKNPCESCLAIAIALTPLSVPAQSSPWSVEWNLRARHEQVSDAAYAREANAETLRLRAGLRFAGDGGWNGLLEAEGIVASGGYDSGANDESAHPQVVDPAGVELNQAFVGWKNAAFSAIVGRQRLVFDNQRWVGNSGWRQNEQTFDALALEFTPRKDLSLRYAFLDRVHRVNGDDALDPRARERALSTHLFNAAWRHGTQQLGGYAYLLEDRDVAAASTATWGLRWTGTRPLASASFGWTLDAARQRDHADNPLRFSHAYWLVEPTVTVRGTNVRAGWEHLGGDGAHALQAPLGTLHAFNGWADKFTATPANGLDDRYLGVGRVFGRERGGARAAWQVAWHDFRADSGGARYGREWDASLSLPIARGTTALLKFADYRADAYAADTRKLWLQVEYAGKR